MSVVVRYLAVSYPNPMRERGTDSRRFRDACDQSLAHASGYEPSSERRPPHA
jgi:hypothetical protein